MITAKKQNNKVMKDIKKGDKKSNAGVKKIKQKTAPVVEAEPEEDVYEQGEYEGLNEEYDEEDQLDLIGEKEAQNGEEDYDEEENHDEQDELGEELLDENDMMEGDDEPLDLEKNILEADLGLLNMKIQDILKKLAVIKTSQNYTGPPRVQLLVELKKLFSRFFNYNSELMEYIMGLFSPAECHAFLEMMDTSRPVTIRINSLKTTRAALVKSLTEKSVSLEPLDEISKMAFKINASKIPIGATPEYLAGHYMLQSAASMLPVRALAPQPGERVLDLAAAPGGKTTHIGQLMKNRGVLVANDLKKERLKALYFNCQRMGVSNVVITNYDGRKFPSSLKNFDRVLLDAPCTGLGIISRDPTIKAHRTVLDIQRAAHLQRELLRKAIDVCKVGGYVVYSTCSIAVEENEAVVDYVCKKRYVKIVDTGLEIQTKPYTKYKDTHFNDRIKYCVRVFPHIHNLDGFFVAKLLKVKDGQRQTGAEEEELIKAKKANKINNANGSNYKNGENSKKKQNGIKSKLRKNKKISEETLQENLDIVQQKTKTIKNPIENNEPSLRKKKIYKNIVKDNTENDLAPKATAQNGGSKKKFGAKKQAI